MLNEIDLCCHNSFRTDNKQANFQFIAQILLQNVPIMDMYGVFPV